MAGSSREIPELRGGLSKGIFSNFMKQHSSNQGGNCECCCRLPKACVGIPGIAEKLPKYLSNRAGVRELLKKGTVK